jgi:molybdenum cofactor cytidylyltransferase
MISALVLAAGQASRMGQPKQLLPIAGTSLVRRAVETALGSPVGEVVVVVGRSADEVEHELQGLAARVVRNDRFAEGMSTSLRAGVGALAPHSEAVIVLLADQVLLSTDVVASIVTRYQASRAPLVIPVYGGQRGNPVLFASHLYTELLTVEGDAGARSVVAKHLGDAELVTFDDSKLQMDVDTWDEYQAAKAAVEDRR